MKILKFAIITCLRKTFIMPKNSIGRLVILSGPSCVGKSPLSKSLNKFYPDIFRNLQPLVLYNSRSPRPGEVESVDYYFRSREEIEALKSNEQYIVLYVRGDLQALDLEDLSERLQKGDVFFEGNPFVGRALQTNPHLEAIEKLSIFMAPLSREEILFFKHPSQSGNLKMLVTDIMRRKLLRRTRRQKIELSIQDLENIEKRASSAFTELQDARYFDYVIPNHDGEDSENWDAFYYPIGDARKTLLAFTALIRGEKTEYAEQWESDLLS